MLNPQDDEAPKRPMETREIQEPLRWLGAVGKQQSQNKTPPAAEEQRLTGEHCEGLEGLGRRSCLVFKNGHDTAAVKTTGSNINVAKSSI